MQLWYRDAQVSGLSSKEAGKNWKATHYQLAAAGPAGFRGSALSIHSPMSFIDCGHQYLNAFLPPFHPMLTGAGSYCYKDKRAHNLAESCFCRGTPAAWLFLIF